MPQVCRFAATEERTHARLERVGGSGCRSNRRPWTGRSVRPHYRQICRLPFRRDDGLRRSTGVSIRRDHRVGVREEGGV